MHCGTQFSDWACPLRIAGWQPPSVHLSALALTHRCPLSAPQDMRPRLCWTTAAPATSAAGWRGRWTVTCSGVSCSSSACLCSQPSVSLLGGPWGPGTAGMPARQAASVFFWLGALIDTRLSQAGTQGVCPSEATWRCLSAWAWQSVFLEWATSWMEGQPNHLPSNLHREKLLLRLLPVLTTVLFRSVFIIVFTVDSCICLFVCHNLFLIFRHRSDFFVWSWSFQQYLLIEKFVNTIS